MSLYSFDTDPPSRGSKLKQLYESSSSFSLLWEFDIDPVDYELGANPINSIARQRSYIVVIDRVWNQPINLFARLNETAKREFVIDLAA
jgi:hypothetical protein